MSKEGLVYVFSTRELAKDFIEKAELSGAHVKECAWEALLLYMTGRKGGR